MEAKFITPDSWHDILKIAERGGRLWYQAPFNLNPVPVYVRRVFKNGKIRLWGGEVAFTADEGHLSRFRVKEGH
jgi:hypothetical protein